MSIRASRNVQIQVMSRSKGRNVYPGAAPPSPNHQMSRATGPNVYVGSNRPHSTNFEIASRPPDVHVEPPMSTTGRDVHPGVAMFMWGSGCSPVFTMDIWPFSVSIDTPNLDGLVGLLWIISVTNGDAGPGGRRDGCSNGNAGGGG